MRNLQILGRLLSVSSTRCLGAALCFLTAIAASAPSTMMTRQPDFDARSLVGGSTDRSGPSSVSGFSLTNPNRFSMQQSYSVSAMSSSAGSSSSGLYLNTVGYKISDPLFLFVDVGIYTPLHSTVQGPYANGAGNGAAGSSVVLPRMGLEYRPSDRLTFNVELVNQPDAWKAYGPGYGASSFYGSRFP